MGTRVISRFKDKPKTGAAWWALGLGLSTTMVGPILGISAAVLRPLIDKIVGEYIGAMVGFCVAVFAFILPIAALAASVRAYQKGERSWILWVGFVPAILSAAFLLFLVVGEFIFPH